MKSSDYRRIARKNLANHWWMSIGAGFAAMLFGGLIVGGEFQLTVREEALYELPKFLVTFFATWAGVTSILAIPRFVIGGTVQLGYTKFLLKQHDRSAPLELNELFSQFYRIGTGFAQKFLRILYIVIWSLLLIVPGVIKSYAYAMTPFIMADNPELTANEAITASKQLMDGHKFELFCLDLGFLGWSLFSILTFGIANLLLNPYKHAAYAAFYREIV